MLFQSVHVEICFTFSLTKIMYNVMYLQANIFVLAWSREGQMLAVAEKVILPLLTAYMFLLIILGAVAVGLQLQN